MPVPSPGVAAAIASSALTVPLAMSISSSPSPNHPRTLLWYEALRKPTFKPPDWAFPLAWTGIEAGLSVAAYRLLRSVPSADRSKALALWACNVFMIGGWSRLFFKRRNLPLSTAAAAALIGTSAAFVHTAKPVDKVASRAGIPLVAWVAFATVLTASIWRRNSRIDA